jgi:hypothetical protein
MDERSEFETAATRKRTLTGCLAAPVGFVVSGLVLIPPWFYWAFQVETNATIDITILSISAGVGYALAFGTLTAIGMRNLRRNQIIVITVCAILGFLIGVEARDAMLLSCSMGTGPQPSWCDQTNPGYLRAIVPVYMACGVILGLAMYLAATLRLAEPIRRP